MDIDILKGPGPKSVKAFPSQSAIHLDHLVLGSFGSSSFIPRPVIKTVTRFSGKVILEELLGTIFILANPEISLFRISSD